LRGGQEGVSCEGPLIKGDQGAMWGVACKNQGKLRLLVQKN